MNNALNEERESIKKMEGEVYNAKTLDKAKGFALIDAYVSYSKDHPKDTLSAEYLFKAADIAMNLQTGSQAILYYDKILSNYPNFNKRPECVFLKAFIYENQLGDLKEAEKQYKEFIKTYPDHTLAKDAKASLEYLGKSPEELIKIFQEKNQGK